MSVWKKLSELAAAATDGRLLGTLSGEAPMPVPAADVRAGAERSVAFTMAVIALSAKMAKADGVVLGVEVSAFHRGFQVEQGAQADVDRLFNLAQQDVAGYDVYADQIARGLDHNKLVLGDVLDSLFHIATADRALHPAENAFLADVAARFGFTDSEFRYRRAHFVIDPSSPYDVLGIDPAASDDEVKRRHRKLIRENHPDLLIGRGVPAEAIAAATRRLVAINDAYATVSRERGL